MAGVRVRVIISHHPHFMKPSPLLRLLALTAPAATLTVQAAPTPLITFETRVLSTEFHSEGAAAGDFNKDGVRDVVSGPNIFFGPDFKKGTKIYEAPRFDVRTYSRNFIAYVYDVTGDGWDDVKVLGFPGEEAYWFENPQGAEGLWKRHVALNGVDNESPTFVDVNGDKKPEIVCSVGERFGFAEPQWEDPAETWRFTPVSAVIPGMGRFTHGLGLGDVNNDGRVDLMWKSGWMEQPADLRKQPEWTSHEAPFGTGGAQMYAYDFDGDGDSDVLTSMAAHGFGFSWFENLDGGGKQWKEHLIIGDEADTSPSRVAFSQHHALDVADFDGDGVLDFVTGKRWFAHNGSDAGGMDPAVLYWFRTVRGGGAGKVTFEPHFIDDDSGVGTQVMATDVNADGHMDVVVGNKKGTFVHLQQRPAAAADGSLVLHQGDSLDGWTGDRAFWRAENGVIIGESTAERPLTQNSFLTWGGGKLADFELRLKFRLTGGADANAGIQFRSQSIDNGHGIKGYQADIDNSGNYAGVLWDEHGRGLLGAHGVKVVHDRSGRLKAETRFEEAEKVKMAFQSGGWNEYVITAAGEHITLSLNGVTTTKVIDRTYIDRKPDGAPVNDQQPKEERELHGLLALQLHSGGPTKIEYKDIRLTALPGAVRPVE
jgi:hypothetical protein